MAAIAKFVSFDGGIAFSERALKIQKRDADSGRVVQLSEIAEMRVSEPLFGDDGSIGILFRGERRISEENTIYFDEAQYEEAVRFKVAFDGVVADSRVELPPLEMFAPNVPARREPVRRAMQPVGQQQARRQPRQLAQAGNRPRTNQNQGRQQVQQPGRRRPDKKGRLKKIIIYTVVALLGIGVVGEVFGLNEQKTSGGTLETGPTASVSEAWTSQDGEEQFLGLAKDAVFEKTVGDGERVTDISLNGDDLTVIIDLSGSTAAASETTDTINDFLLQRFDHVAESILDLGEQYDSMWRTITVDFGEYGKVSNDRFHIDELDGGERYFPDWTSEIVPGSVQAGMAATGSAGAGIEALSGAVQTETSTYENGYTSPPVMTAAPATPAPTQEPVPAGTKYVLNTSTMKFHYPSCRDVGKINAGNRQDYTGTRDSVINMGYSPCGHCHP